MSKRPITAVLLLLSLSVSLRGQLPQQKPTAPPKSERTPAGQQQNAAHDDDEDVVRITTNLVQIDAVVTRSGKQITDLRAGDFEIFEDGHPQPITNFSYVWNVPTPPFSPANIAVAPTVSPVEKAKTPPVLPSLVHPRDVRRTVAVVVDDLGISSVSMAKMKRVLRKFVDEEVQPNDLVAIIRTGADVGALQSFTTDKRLLYGAIDQVRANPCNRIGISDVPTIENGALVQNEFQTGQNCSAGATLKSLRFIVQGMRELPGRKSMILLSDSIPDEANPDGYQGLQTTSLDRQSAGGDRQNKSTQEIMDERRAMSSSRSTSYADQLQLLTQLAIRASVVIYAIRPRGVLYFYGPTAADDLASTVERHDQFSTSPTARRDELIRQREDSFRQSDYPSSLASKTGGLTMQSTNDISGGLRKIMDDQRGFYLIGYRPSGETFNRRFHQIKVQVKGNGLSVRTRAGFYGISDTEVNAQLTAQDQMLKALTSPFGSGDIDVRMATLFANTKARGSFLRSVFHIAARDITFTDQADGWHEAEFDLSGIIFGDNGTVVGRHNQKETLHLRGQTYDRVLRDGLDYHFDVLVKKPGSYQFRLAVRDSVSSHIGTAGQFIDVPDLRKDRLTLSSIALWGDASSLGIENVDSQRAAGLPSGVLEHGAQIKTGSDSAPTSRAVRRFRQGSSLVFGYAAYNARIDKTTNRPRLTAQARIFRDGKPVYVGDVMPIDATGQSDMARLTIGGSLQLGTDLAPGEYVLQLIVDDPLAKDKQRTATQWTDFEIVKQ
jgi:VWFA-related protein